MSGKLDIGAPNVVRFKTGNIPTGIAVRGRFGYVNNEVGHSVSILDLNSNGNTVAFNVPSSEPPKPGTHEHAVLLGKLVFFTALGVSDNGLVGQDIRAIDPLLFRGKQSSDAWSTCGSCHPAGLSDGVTWIFGDGPRNTIPLDGLYSKINGPHDIRINNYSAARDSITDFNNNSRGVQGGVGFASDPPFSAAAPNPAVFDHGISQGASEALDFETEWGETVRPLNQPQAPGAAAGAAVFATNCASCHGGAKWTKSQVLYGNNPALGEAAGTPPVRPVRDPGLLITANQAVSYTNAVLDPNPLQFIENIGTFIATNPIEIRGAGAPASRGRAGGNTLGRDPGRLQRPLVARHWLPRPLLPQRGGANADRCLRAARARGRDDRIDTGRSAGQSTGFPDFLGRPHPHPAIGRRHLQGPDEPLVIPPSRAGLRAGPHFLPARRRPRLPRESFHVRCQSVIRNDPTRQRMSRDRFRPTGQAIDERPGGDADITTRGSRRGDRPCRRQDRWSSSPSYGKLCKNHPLYEIGPSPAACRRDIDACGAGHSIATPGSLKYGKASGARAFSLIRQTVSTTRVRL